MTAIGHGVTALERASGSGGARASETSKGTRIELGGGVEASMLADPHPDCHSTVALQPGRRSEPVARAVLSRPSSWLPFLDTVTAFLLEHRGAATDRRAASFHSRHVRATVTAASPDACTSVPKRERQVGSGRLSLGRANASVRRRCPWLPQ